MSVLNVGIGECLVSRDINSVLAIYALGSCIAVAIHDRAAAVGGLLHFMLPESALNPEKACTNPYMFADTGIPLLFTEAYRLGAEKRRLVVRVAGGAQLMDEDGVFNIGRRNHLAFRKLLWRAGMVVHGEDIGGVDARTVRLEVASGRFWVLRPELRIAKCQRRETRKAGADGSPRSDRGSFSGSADLYPPGVGDVRRGAEMSTADARGGGNPGVSLEVQQAS